MDSNKEQQQYIFALDIGTRSVVGTVGVLQGDIFKVVDYEQRFHAKRAMRDGQIEDIALVAKVVSDVKQTLEERLKTKFEKVSIAAAGRSLKTIKTTYEQEIVQTEEITKKLMQGVEYSALSKAMDEFCERDDEDHNFHCVGYSVVRSSLDDYDMSNLVGHKGKKITVDLIAAFLPHNVVEGLYATMSLTGLEVENLTLEPMAAIHIIVPKDIRLLNIAIVDIGAGTSDIAICRNGGISAYDMVTIAGDELTEKLMQRYLVDFDEAEKIKFALSDSNETITFKDVLGFETTTSKDEIFEFTNEISADLAQIISQRILQINTNSPVAVFIVGGGSQVPNLCDIVAKHLDLPKNRVTIGGKQGFKYVEISDEKLNNPEFVTPIGIGAITSERAGSDFFAITVNGNKIMLLRQGEIKVMEAILLAGIKPTALIGVPPRPINYTLNGKKKIFRQEYTSGEIKINGKLASIDSTLSRGDALVVVPAKSSEKQTVTAQEIQQNEGGTTVFLNNQEYTLYGKITVNGNEVANDYAICNDDEVLLEKICTLADLCKIAEIDTQDKVFICNDEDIEIFDALQQYDNIEYIQTETEIQKSDIIKDNQSEIKTQDKVVIHAQKSQGSQGKQGTPIKISANRIKAVPVKKHIDEEKVFDEKDDKTDSLPQDIQDISTQQVATEQQTETLKTTVSEITIEDTQKAENQIEHIENEIKTTKETQKGQVETPAVNQSQELLQQQKETQENQPEQNVSIDNLSQQNSSISFELNAENQDAIKSVTPQENGYVPYEQRKEKGYIFVTLNGQPTKVKAENDDKVMFVNMLNYVRIENEAPGENLVLEINAKPASYTDEVCDGDEVTIKWE